MTGRIGVAAVTAGPGLTNTVTAVKNAQMAESPLLLIGKIFKVFNEQLKKITFSKTCFSAKFFSNFIYFFSFSL